MSTFPPAATGTMMCTGFDGYCAAGLCAFATVAKSRHVYAAIRNPFSINPSSNVRHIRCNDPGMSSRTDDILKEFDMLHYALVFFIVAIVAAVFGFGGIAAGAAG